MRFTIRGVTSGFLLGGILIGSRVDPAPPSPAEKNSVKVKTLIPGTSEARDWVGEYDGRKLQVIYHPQVDELPKALPYPQRKRLRQFIDLRMIDYLELATIVFADPITSLRCTRDQCLHLDAVLLRRTRRRWIHPGADQNAAEQKTACHTSDGKAHRIPLGRQGPSSMLPAWAFRYPQVRSRLPRRVSVMPKFGIRSKCNDP